MRSCSGISKTILFTARVARDAEDAEGIDGFPLPVRGRQEKKPMRSAQGLIVWALSEGWGMNAGLMGAKGNGINACRAVDFWFRSTQSKLKKEKPLSPSCLE